jgi:hypothetical protein
VFYSAAVSCHINYASRGRPAVLHLLAKICTTRTNLLYCSLLAMIQ